MHLITGKYSQVKDNIGGNPYLWTSKPCLNYEHMVEFLNSLLVRRRIEEFNPASNLVNESDNCSSFVKGRCQMLLLNLAIYFHYK